MAATCSCSAAGAAIARHSASFGSEAGQAEQAFVRSCQSFGRPTLGNFLDAYPDLLGIEGRDENLPWCRWHQLVGRQDALADERNRRLSGTLRAG